MDASNRWIDRTWLQEVQYRSSILIGRTWVHSADEPQNGWADAPDRSGECEPGLTRTHVIATSSNMTT